MRRRPRTSRRLARCVTHWPASHEWRCGRRWSNAAWIVTVFAPPTWQRPIRRALPAMSPSPVPRPSLGRTSPDSPPRRRMPHLTFSAAKVTAPFLARRWEPHVPRATRGSSATNVMPARRRHARSRGWHPIPDRQRSSLERRRRRTVTTLLTGTRRWPRHRRPAAPAVTFALIAWSAIVQLPRGAPGITRMDS